VVGQLAQQQPEMFDREWGNLNPLLLAIENLGFIK
jgi:hypothetical protein